MKPHAIALAVVLLLCAGPWPVRAQDANPLRILVEVKVGRQDRGDRRSTGGYVDPGATGKTQTFAFSRLEGQCGTGVGPKPLGDVGEAFDGTMKKVYSAWLVHVTPTTQAGEAVTFRVQWTRIRDNGKPSTVADDAELTLRPGESLSLDVMPQSPEPSEPPPGCVVKALSLSVGVVHWPEPEKIGAWSRSISGSWSGCPMERSAASRCRCEGATTTPCPSISTPSPKRRRRSTSSAICEISPGSGPTEIKMTTRSRVIDLKPSPLSPQRPPG